MAQKDVLNLRMTFEDGTNSTMSISSYKENSATKANLQTLANAAKDVLETSDGAAFASISNAVRTTSTETTLNETAELPIAPSESSE